MTMTSVIIKLLQKQIVESPTIHFLLFIPPISSNLKWNEHVKNVIKKANKRIYFIIQLKHAHVPTNATISFHCTCIRSSCEVFHFSLPKYLSTSKWQHWTVSKACIINYPPWKIVLWQTFFYKPKYCNLHDWHCRYQLTKKTFNSIVGNRNRHDFLPDVNVSSYSLRDQRDFFIPKCKTNRFKQSFLPARASDF